MTSAITRWVATLATVTLAALAAAGMAAPGAAAEETPVAVANFTLKDLEGQNVSLHDLLAEGPVLVAFWATWCKPCLQELPKIAERSDEWAEKGLTTLAISIDKTRSHGRVRSYARAQDFGFDVLLDPNQEAFRKLQGQSVPYLVVLDASGETRYAKVGYRPGDEKALAAAIDALLAGDAGEGAADTAPTPGAGG